MTGEKFIPKMCSEKQTRHSRRRRCHETPKDVDCKPYEDKFIGGTRDNTKLKLMRSLKLIPKAEAEEMKKRRSKRSTANPHFSFIRERSSTFYYTLNSRLKSLEEEKSRLNETIRRDYLCLEMKKQKREELREVLRDLVESNETKRIQMEKLIKVKDLKNFLSTELFPNP
ncbi:unnamed protein product [Dimorphilus gyrociliatus]|uniref:Uncharacterized protein n=1 Tax=Dimorphilus gyrociliatus TaxID=2664684 RepID=A0A7I8VHY3_9ANNE|nr:unnamed protein product [Dimorphilus gyrociliatus]